MATNTQRWLGNAFGAEPLIQQLKVAAGSGQAIKQGELCYLDVITDDVTIVAGTTTNLHAIVIANEEQRATDAARLMEFIIPKHGDMFDFALDAATTIAWGDELQMYTSDPTETLAKSTTDAIAWAVNVQAPGAGTTWPTVTRVTAMLKRALVGGLNLPFCGILEGDSS